MAFKSLSSLSATVAKATSNDLMSPKQKHLDVLLQRINVKDANLDEISIPLIEKMQSHNWQTNYKAIITLNFLIQNGNEKFLQNICAKKPGFTNAKRFIWAESNVIRFLHKHSDYLETKLNVYNNAGFDYCRVRRGQNGFLRTINPSRVFEHLSHLRKVMEAIVQFNPKENDLRAALVLSSFSKVFKDLVYLFQFLNDGIIILIERFFELDVEKSRKALEIYKFCLSISGIIKGIFAEAQEVGIDKTDFSSYVTYRTDMVVTMETHIKSLQTKSQDNLGATIEKLTHPTSTNNSAYKQTTTITPSPYRKQYSTPFLTSNHSPLGRVVSFSPPNLKSDRQNLFPVQFESTYSTTGEGKVTNQPISTKSNPTSPNMSHKIYTNLKQKSVPDLFNGLHHDLLELQDCYSVASTYQPTNKNYHKKNSNPFDNGEFQSIYYNTCIPRLIICIFHILVAMVITAD